MGGGSKFSFALGQEAVSYFMHLVGKGFKYKLNSCKLMKWVFGELEARYHYQQISLTLCMHDALLAHVTKRGESSSVKKSTGVVGKEERRCYTAVHNSNESKNSLGTFVLLLCVRSCLAW